jgi:hypothetical protein
MLWFLQTWPIPMILPLLAMQRLSGPVSGVCASAVDAGATAAINIAAADAPTSQRHAFLKE